MARVPSNAAPKATRAKAPAEPASGKVAAKAPVKLVNLKRLLAGLDQTLAHATKARDRIAAEIARIEKGSLH